MKKYITKFPLLYLVVFVSFFEFTGTKLYAQNKYDYKQFFEEGGDLAKQPLKWSLGDWFIAGGLAAGSYAIMQFDEDIRSEMLKDRSYAESIPLTLGRFYGEPYTSLGIGAYFLIQGNSSGNLKNKKLGFEILGSFIYTGIITSIVKVAFGRTRPYRATNAFEFEPFASINNDFLSFFSGHASTSFSLSTVIAANVKGTGWKVLSYFPAFVTGFSRIYHNRHWTSDVVMGAAVGYLIGRFVVNSHEEKEKYQDSNFATPSPLFQITIPIN